MKIRILSDLHIDINYKYNLALNDDVFTLIAGDISGNPDEAIEWVKANVKNGAFISGNHDIYDTPMTIERVKEKYHNAFPASSNVTYFDDDVDVVSKEIAPGILLVADVLYTDYMLCLNPRVDKEHIQERNMQCADPYARFRNGGMNDFRYGKCEKEYGQADLDGLGVYRLTPQWYLDHHLKAWDKITRIISENRDKQVILMTHHCMSPKCIDNDYLEESSSICASYVSDKEEWLSKQPNLKCIISGHIHCRKKFNVGNAMYVMNALGYAYEHLFQNNGICDGKSMMWSPDCILDTDNWAIVYNEEENPEWRKIYDGFMAFSNIFM